MGLLRSRRSVRLSMAIGAALTSATSIVAAGTFAQVAEATPTAPFHQCPGIGADTSCALLIDITSPTASTVLQDSGQGPFDGTEDTLLGVQNDSSSPVSGLYLTSPTGLTIFGVEGDGICTFAPYVPSTDSTYCSGAQYGSDPLDYAGPDNTFANYLTNTKQGEVVFTTPLAPGASTYFSLEEKINAGDVSQIAAPSISVAFGGPSVVITKNRP